MQCTTIVIETSGIQIYHFVLKTNYGKIQLNIWDTIGQEKFGAVRDCFYSDASGAIVMFDCTSYETVANAFEVWLRDLTEICGTKIPIALCANKVDSADRKTKPYRGPRVNVKYYDVSGITRYNIDAPFLYLIREITGYVLYVGNININIQGCIWYCSLLILFVICNDFSQICKGVPLHFITLIL